MELNQFLSQGKYLDIDNNKLFVIDTEKGINGSTETIVIINGFPTISYDYYKVINELKNHYRVIVFDHFGFGFSNLPDTYCFSLIYQADVCIKLWSKLK